ncbi:MAG: PIG-L deacetylase family protein [Acidobacteriota bacterium]
MSPLGQLDLDAGSRVLVVAPHPDDESLVTGGLLLRALRAGAVVHVAYFTDGENNPWAQRAFERRWRVGPGDRARFGELRRSEALAALAELGVSPDAVTFLRWPDQGVTDILRRADETPLSSLAAVFSSFRPTVVVGPSVADLHPDHSAVAVLVRLALARRTDVRHLEAAVHHPDLRQLGRGALLIASTAEEREHKLAAVLHHQSQMMWRRGWLRAFVDRDEAFWDATGAVAVAHPVCQVGQTEGVLVVAVRSAPRLRACGRRRLLIVGHDAAGHLACLAADLPVLSGSAPVITAGSSPRVGLAHYRGGPRRGAVRIEGAPVVGFEPLFVKVERRFGFFDEAGWAPLPLPSATARPARV